MTQTQSKGDSRASLLRAALDAAARGWPVIPLRPGGKAAAGHRTDRCPGTGRCASGHLKPEQRATTDPDLIHAAWAHRAFNVGIATGPAGLLVVDLDTVKAKAPNGTPDGITTFKALCERTGQPVPTTYRVRTPSGGWHLYFTAPAQARFGNTAGTLAPLVDTRAWGGYVVAPGSIVDGTPYEVVHDRPPAALPAWLAHLLQGPAKPARAPLGPVHRSASRVAAVVLERETAAVENSAEGGRNSMLLRAVRAVGRFVAWGDLPRHVVEEAFQGAGEAAGLPPSECRATIRSALDYSIRTARPRDAA